MVEGSEGMPDNERSIESTTLKRVSCTDKSCESRSPGRSIFESEASMSAENMWSASGVQNSVQRVVVELVKKTNLTTIIVTLEEKRKENKTTK